MTMSASSSRLSNHLLLLGIKIDFHISMDYFAELCYINAPFPLSGAPLGRGIWIYLMSWLGQA